MKFCRSCLICQKVGKANQKIPQAKLHPIPVAGKPFEEIMIDFVGPLPKSKTGKMYLLTIMCRATRYPEAIALSSTRSCNVISALVSFFGHLVHLRSFNLIMAQVSFQANLSNFWINMALSRYYRLPIVLKVKEH